MKNCILSSTMNPRTRLGSLGFHTKLPIRNSLNIPVFINLGSHQCPFIVESRMEFYSIGIAPPIFLPIKNSLYFSLNDLFSLILKNVESYLGGRLSLFVLWKRTELNRQTIDFNKEFFFNFLKICKIQWG